MPPNDPDQYSLAIVDPDDGLRSVLSSNTTVFADLMNRMRAARWRQTIATVSVVSLSPPVILFLPHEPIARTLPPLPRFR